MKWLSFLVRTLKAELNQKSWLRPPNEPRNKEPCFGRTMLRGSPNQNPEKKKGETKRKKQKSDRDFAKQKTKKKTISCLMFNPQREDFRTVPVP